MGDDDEVHLHVTYAGHFDMDAAFCARMRMAIAAGLENASIGVVTTPGTTNPKYISTKQPATFSQWMDLQSSLHPPDHLAKTALGVSVA